MPRPRIYTEEEARERKNARQREYAKRTGNAASLKSHKKNYRNYIFPLNINTDRDIIEMLEQVENKQGYFKKLIREDIERRKTK